MSTDRIFVSNDRNYIVVIKSAGVPQKDDDIVVVREGVENRCEFQSRISTDQLGFAFTAMVTVHDEKELDGVVTGGVRVTDDWQKMRFGFTLLTRDDTVLDDNPQR